jgi:hypothetical protein
MPYLYVTQCPHCCAENATLTAKCIAETKTKDRYNIFMQCNVCKLGVIIIVDDRYRCHSNNEYENGALLDDIFLILDMFPKRNDIDTPDYTPKNISEYFRQAVDSLQRSNFDAAGMMFRKVVDVTTKKLGATTGKLNNRIDTLAEKHEITPAMQEWAHVIRLDGNEAAHEEEPFDRETCEALKSFTELFLMYVFSLPGMLEERRAAKEG